MNDVCFILLILVLIIILSRNSDIENFTDEDGLNEELDGGEETNLELPKETDAPKKLKEASENVPTKHPKVQMEENQYIKVGGYEEGDLFA